MGFEILEDGETALLYKYNGQVHVKTGPRRLFLARSKLVRLQRYSAQHDEYLRIKFKDGKIEHRIGPCDEILNTQIYSDISVEKCFCLDANQALIVYKAEREEAKHSHKIIKGPGIFAIEPEEWVHTFSWHGCADDNKTHYVANQNKFSVLNLAPSQLYYNVDDVRTADDALIRIKLMIFYELTDIEKMLNETKDPIADFINCCCSDVVSYTLKMSYLQFIESCHELNDLERFPTLVNRAAAIGFEVSKVVFRGYLASPKLQSLHDSSVENRTKLKLEFESELQKQEMQDSNLKNELDRLQSEQELELQKLIASQDLERSRVEASLKLKQSNGLEKILRDKEIKLNKLAAVDEKNVLQCQHLRTLAASDINPAKYLLASTQQAEKVIQIVQPSTPASSANLHFHD